MDDDSWILGSIVIVVLIIVVPLVGIGWFIASRPTTYCTDWVKAVSIEPSFEDNGKHEDEQYVVKYEDGSVTGQDQGLIPFARCTAQTRVHQSDKQPGWKEVSTWGDVNWQQ